MGHASLVGHEGGEVHGPTGVVLREGLGLAAVPLRPLLGQKALGAVAGGLELTVRLGEGRV